MMRDDRRGVSADCVGLCRIVSNFKFYFYLIQRTEFSVTCFELVIQRFMHMQVTYGAVFYSDD